MDYNQIRKVYIFNSEKQILVDKELNNYLTLPTIIIRVHKVTIGDTMNEITHETFP